jgi:hypothetical protein
VKFSSLFIRRFRWINLPGTLLVAVLQRAPAMRVAAVAEQMFTSSPIGAVLKMAAAAVAALGAIDTVAGATQWVLTPGGSQSGQTPTVNESGTAGAALSLGFTVIQAQTPAGSFRIAGLPPGLSVPGMNSSGILNASSGVITGTPTTGGTFSTTIRAYEFNNGTGDAWGPITLRFTITGSAAVGPTITTQPASQTVNAGATVTFTVVATGSPAPTYQWRKNSAAISGATNATLTLPSVTAVDAGSYAVVVTNTAATVTSSTATLTVNVAGPAPVFTSQPTSVTVATGGAAVFSAAATGATGFQWQRNGAPIAGATNASLVLTGGNVTAGAYNVIATNGGGAAASNSANLTVVNTTDVGRLVNLAIRTNDGTGAQTLIVGFAIGGAGTIGSKPLLLRGVGPSLGQFGLSAFLVDPAVTVFRSDQSTMAVNDNWSGDTTVKARATAVGAFPLIADNSLDAALAIAPPSGSYTVQVTGNNNGTGIALAEIYDASPAFTTATPRLINVSARTQVGTGNDVLIAGFVIGGSTAKTVLIRAIGPTLVNFGVDGALTDPQLTLFDGAQAVVATNDDWGGDPQLTATGNSVGAFALADPASKDSMLLVTLAPGSYTAKISGAGSTTGVALVEVYEVP